MKAMPVDQVWSRTVREERNLHEHLEPIRTQAEVAAILGLTRQGVHEAERKIIDKIAAEIVAIGDEVAAELRADLYGEDVA